MPKCPNCHQLIESEAIACPFCHMELTAYGHPGIPLYRANDTEFLCPTCVYHVDDSCDFPQRPHAKTCTLYHHESQPLFSSELAKPQTLLSRTQGWLQRHSIIWIAIALILVSFAIALAQS